MADNPIQKLMSKIQGVTGGEQLTRTNTPKVADSLGGLPPAMRRPSPLGAARPTLPQQQLKNASIVYGLGSLLLYALAFYNLANAEWFNGLMLLLPSTCLAYLAYRYMIQAE